MLCEYIWVDLLKVISRANSISTLYLHLIFQSKSGFTTVQSISLMKSVIRYQSKATFAYQPTMYSKWWETFKGTRNSLKIWMAVIEN